MPINFDCSCGKTLRVPDEHAGRRVKCPACAVVSTVPTPEPMFEVVEEPAAPPPKARPVAKAAPSKTDDDDDRGYGVAKKSRREEAEEEEREEEEERRRRKKRRRPPRESSRADDDYDRPARRRSGSAIPEPGLFKAMGIAFLWVIVSVVVSLIINEAFGVGVNAGRGGQGNPFGPGAGGRDPILALGASCFQLVFGFLVFAGLFTLLLPTTFPRALLVTVFFYLEYIALIILVVIAVFVFFAAAGGGGFK